ncbi:MAG: TldD/PmbA family protein [Anaerolineae bacterium]|nr:TldD/PmbA family protein [Anaerolineae bacterium]NIN96916.1 TldD/PmbA family protein [Anaerolineae bacterium]NIQ79881.1 TldD/PmbA family protein [Anaerolineae bacterium]
MDELADRALNLAQTRGATYADIRIIELETQSVAVKNGIVEGVALDSSRGFGVRVIADGAWGFASSARCDPEKVDKITALAIQVAKASALVRGDPIDLGPPEAHKDTYRTPVELDPFQVSLEEKIDLLLACDEAMRRAEGVAVAEGNMLFMRERQLFASSEGSFIEQEIFETGVGLVATAVDEDEVQTRSYPNTFGRHQGTAGYEFIERYDLPGNAERLGEEAVALLSARQCPSGVTTLILGPTQLALQVHESCGHPTELDRALGTEAAYAGTSFLTPERLGTFRYGSDIVNITADATLPGGLGTFGYDDEGVPAQRTHLVEDGTFVGYLTSRETASRLGKRSNGTMRADGWSNIPLIRMTNINLEPGEWELDDLIADTDEGIYMEMNKSWSIDDKRLNFQFGTEIAYEIKNGKWGELLKNATYAGMTPQFWGSCDAICNDKYWDVWGTPNCGKGQPSQVAHVGHGASLARFLNVQVGVMK